MNVLESHDESHGADPTSKLNWLRAAVLGANDGIVSTASIVVGVAGASNSPSFILTAGVAGLVAGALSMAAGEYVSVSTQRDTEIAYIEKERKELEDEPEFELKELIEIYKTKGLSPATAQTVAQELTAHDALGAHIDAELGMRTDSLVNPLHAALASAGAFFCGAVIPLIAVMLPPATWRVPVTFIAVVIALAITGSLSAQAGGAHRGTAIARVIVGGMIAMIVTYGIGALVGQVGL